MKILRKLKIHGNKIFAYFSLISMLANVAAPFAAVFPVRAYAEDTGAPVEEVSVEKTDEDTPEEADTEEAEDGQDLSAEEGTNENEITEEASVEASEEEVVADTAEEVHSEEEVVENEIVSEEIVDPQAPDILEDGVMDYNPLNDIEEVTEVADLPAAEGVVSEEVNPAEVTEAVEEYVYLEDGAEVVDTTDEDWDVDGEVAETKEVVEIGVKYIFPLDEDVSVTFTKLPSSEDDRAKLKIERVKVADLNLPDEFKTDAEYAFDITTEGMENGEFEYDLTLPKPEGVDAEVVYIEKDVEEVRDGVSSEDVKKVEKDKVDQRDGSDEVGIESLDHLTTFIVTGVAGATWTCNEDSQGANDEPGQKDLTLMCYKDGTIDPLEISWNWDEIKLNGSNTGDGCALFDTNSNDNADYSVCVSWGGNQQQVDGTRIFLCDDTRPDRCSANLQTNLKTECTVSDTNTDPFPSGTEYDRDTKATCSIDLGDVGGASRARLLDVCSYPSQQPNSDPSDCIVTPTDKNVGSIEILKKLIPSGDSGRFNLRIDGNVAGAGLNVGDGGSTGVVEVSVNSHSVDEVAYSGTDLGDYVSSIVCKDRGLDTFDGGGALTVSGSGPLSVPVEKDDDIVCTFTNEIYGSITAHKFHDKNMNSIQDSEELDLSGWSMSLYSGSDCDDQNYIGSGSTNNDGDTTFYSIVPGQGYSVKESMQSGWTNITGLCQNFTITPGESKTLEFANAELGSIEGTKYDDIDGNGDRAYEGGSESGLPGWTINLYDSTGLLINTKITDEKGDYWFDDIVAGDYRVCEVQQEGWVNTEPGGGSLCVDITVNPEGTEHVDFGNQRNPITINAAKIVCDYEEYLPNYGTGGPNITSETADNWISNSDGHCWAEPNWYFQWGIDSSVNPGDSYVGEAAGWNTFGPTNSDGEISVKIEDYGTTNQIKVREVLKENYIPFTYLTNGNNSNDVSAEIYCSTDVLNYDNDDRFNPEYGETYYCVAWNVRNDASIQGRKYYDVNANGDFDNEEKNEAGDPNRLDGWTINLFDSDWNLVDSMLTGDDSTPAGNVAKGQYRFIDLLAGKYYVCEEQQVGWYQTEPASGPQFGEEDTYCYEVNVSPGQAVTEIQFGNYQGSNVTLCKFDGQGIGLPGWNLILRGNSPLEGVAVYPNGGTYSSSSLEKGNYALISYGTYEYRGSTGLLTDPAYSERLLVDGYTGPYFPWINTMDLGTPGALGITVNDNPTNWGNYLSYDHRYALGFTDYSGAFDFSVYDNYYSDNVGNMNVDIYNGYVGTTGEEGCVTFTNVPFGTYTIDEVMKDGWRNVGGLNEEVTINEFTEAFEIVNELDVYDIHGYKWSDENGSGDFDGLESLLSGWRINLYSSNGDGGFNTDPIRTMLTDSGEDHYGWYWFKDLFPGEYKVCEELQSGWVQTFPINEDGNCHIINLPMGSSNGYELPKMTNAVDGLVYSFGNQYIEPTSTIAKSNDSTGPEEIGNEVRFTIKVTAHDNNVKDVYVYDLFSDGFEYVNGSWTANSSLRGDIKGSVTSEPSYNSPAAWYLGDMEKDEVVTLTYLARITDDVEAGIYKDLAWTQGEDLLGGEVMGESEAEGYIDSTFVGTQVEVAVEEELNTDVDVKEEEEGEVLGASTYLPATGANALWINILIGLAAVGGLLLLIGGFGEMSKKKDKEVKKGKKAVLGILSLVFVVLFAHKTYAATVVRLSEPDSPVSDEFDLVFVAMDTDDSVDIEAKCYAKKPGSSSFTSFGSTINIPSGEGGDSRTCEVTDSVLDDKGTYEFKVVVNSGSAESNVVSVYYDNDSPDRPKYIEKEKVNSCVNKITLKTADDGQTTSIQVFADDDKEIDIDESHKIETESIGPNEKYSFEHVVSGDDCDETWYYAVVAFDASGNDSKPRVEEITTYKTTTEEEDEVVEAIPVEGGTGITDEGSSTTTEEGTGEDGLLGETSGENGEVLGEETGNENEGKTVFKSPWFWIVLVGLGIVIIGVSRKSKKA